MEKIINNKKLAHYIMVVFGLPLSIMAASSQNIVLGLLFGSLLALGLDGLILPKRFKNKNSKTDLITRTI